MASDWPDFHIPHSEKIEWMIETTGFALEPVNPNPAADPPSPAYAYSIGVPELCQFPEILVCGLTPVAANGLISLVIDARRGNTEIPLGVELIGLLDNDLRCLFAPLDPASAASWCPTAAAWYRGREFPLVQLIYPDRAGVLPYEADYDPRMRLAQPVVGDPTGTWAPGSVQP